MGLLYGSGSGLILSFLLQYVVGIALVVSVYVPYGFMYEGMVGNVMLQVWSLMVSVMGPV